MVARASRRAASTVLSTFPSDIDTKVDAARLEARAT
jgi:hypothetical protein